MIKDPSVLKNGNESENPQKNKRIVREFEIEELLFRHPVRLDDEKTNGYYKDKVVMITGGGGSIGSELCRQIAKMQPKSLIIRDIYENGAYDIQQELKLSCVNLELHVKIVSICDRAGLERIFRVYRPDILIHAESSSSGGTDVLCSGRDQRPGSTCAGNADVKRITTSAFMRKSHRMHFVRCT